LTTPWAGLHAHSAGGAYINFMDADDLSRSMDNYAGNYARLAKN